MFLAKDGTVYFNEINTIPGFTALSRFPKMLMATGMTFPEVVDLLIRKGLPQ